MKIGYARVSSSGQHLDVQQTALTDAGLKENQCLNILIHSDKVLFVPSEDPVEHPGIVVRYKHEI